MKQSLKAFFIMLCAFSVWVIFPHTSDAARFSDVNPNDEYGRAIEKLVELGIVGGYEDQTFRPTNNITRAEVAKIMVGVKQLQDYTNSSTIQDYLDVPNTLWSFNYIKTAKENNIMDGYGNGYFGPDDKLTRGQMAHLLKKALLLSEGPSTLPFTDVPSNAYYFGGIASLYSNEITKGVSETSFAPDSPITRQQLAVFLDRSGILDELLNGDNFTIIDISRIEGQLIDEEKFRYILNRSRDNINSIAQTDLYKEGQFNLDTWTFENLEQGETIFDLYLNDYPLPIYLKLYVSNSTPMYQFYLPKSLKRKANELTGTAYLKEALTNLSIEHNIDLSYINLYLLDVDGDLSYYSYLEDGIFYFEPKSTKPITLLFNFNYEFVEFVLTPYETEDGFDYTVKIK